MRFFTRLLLVSCLLPLPALAAYDVNDVALGAPERDIRQHFPSAHCKTLEWESRAADRRCDDSRVTFGGIEARITFYLRKDKVEAFDLRFDSREADRVVKFLKERYGAPASEVRESLGEKGKAARQVYKVLWEAKGERAVLIALDEKQRASLLVSRGNFEEEIYRVR
jgi:hypothetical protein